ncbi:MAG: class III extradiol ring-cleavage dioxygenase [Pseudomonadota bacterium]|nr:class III extradiol ring-cleavage dioxygenase [Pseudomonadota bacterium]
MRQPAFFLSHGGGPCFWFDFPPPFGPGAWDGLREFLAGLVNSLPARPKAFLVVSAHWEEAIPTVGTAARPPMLFDYYGFPEHTYRLSYPAPGAPDVAARARQLLADAGIDTAENPARGFDHGVFVPFLIADPSATIPVATLSLRHDLDPAFHLALGRALAPLRDAGVVIVGSGQSFHDLRTFGNGRAEPSASFDRWLVDTVTDADTAARDRALVDWERAPNARACHPREEHLVPLMVAAGAGGQDRGQHAFGGQVAGKSISCFRFG